MMDNRERESSEHIFGLSEIKIVERHHPSSNAIFELLSVTKRNHALEDWIFLHLIILVHITVIASGFQISTCKILI